MDNHNKIQLEDEGYSVLNYDQILSREHEDKYGLINGTLLLDGTFVTCDVMEHKILDIELSSLGFEVDPMEPLGGDDVIHVSSSTVTGSRINTYEEADDYFIDMPIPTNEQLTFLFKNNHKLKSYFTNNSIAELIRVRYNEIGYGAKWSNLEFLKDFYSDKIQIPRIESEYFENSCLRTSPYYSLPGILDSHFNFEDSKKAYDDIMLKFEQYKDVIPGNKLWVFFQEFISGVNGVCSIVDNEFSLKASSNIGDVVQGNNSQLVEIDSDNYSYLKHISELLSKDLEKNIQFEFVISESNNTVYITQLRILNSIKDTVNFKIDYTHNIIGTGTCFKSGCAKNISPNQLLVVNENTNPEQLAKNKNYYRGVVLIQDAEFAHILALAQKLNIPAIYNVSFNNDLSNYTSIDFKVNEDKGYIIENK